MSEPQTQTVEERAEEFVSAREAEERAELTQRLETQLALEKDLEPEATAASDAYWKSAKKTGLDNEPTAKEIELQRKSDDANARFMQTGRAISDTRQRLAKLDDPHEHERRVRVKVEELSRRYKNGKDDSMASKTITKRVPVPESVINRIVRDADVKTQQEIAEDLNKAGHKTASGRPWTPQNVWHAFKKATGKGFPRKARAAAPAKPKSAAKPKANAKPKATTAKPKAKPKTGAKPKASANGKRSSGPISKTSQASGTSRGGTGRKDRSK